MTKKWKDTVRDGTPVRIYATAEETGGMIHGAVKVDENTWNVTCWGQDGRLLNASCPHDGDLIEDTESPLREALEEIVGIIEEGDLVDGSQGECFLAIHNVASAALAKDKQP